MQQARFELAYQEAQLMIQERIVKGLPVPPTATASYIIGQQATQLREWKELVRIREDRFLLTMMQTEKSHIPYPDEPPVHFPPAAVWRELTGAAPRRVPELQPRAQPRASRRSSSRASSRTTEVQLKEGEHQRHPAVRAAPGAVEAAPGDVRDHGGVLQGRGRAGHQGGEAQAWPRRNSAG